MPIIKIKDELIHYAHIPKCGGHSIERYLKSISTIDVGFSDWFFIQKPPKNPWNISSPQHIDGTSLSRLFPKSFFTNFVVVSRDPIKKLKSAYLFNKYIQKKISTEEKLNTFIEAKLIHNLKRNGWMDNHFMPQYMFLYPGAKYISFKIEEDGLKKIKTFFDNIIFGVSRPELIEHANETNYSGREEELSLTRTNFELIKEIYSEDFDLFKY